MSSSDPSNGTDWFTANSPPPTATSGGDPSAQITAWYQEYLGRTPSAAEIQSHLQNPGGLAAVQKVIQAAAGTSSEPGTKTGQDAGAAPNPDTTSTPAPNGGGDLLSRVTAALKAANSTDDPNYWVQKIQADPNGQGSAWDYWVGRINQGDGAAAVKNGTTQPFKDSSTSGVAAASAGFGAPPNPYASNPNAPTYTAPTVPTSLSTPYQVQGTAPTAPTLTPFTAPTMADAANDPGYQFGLTQGTKQISSSAAANGTVLNPGTVQALNQYGTDYATTKYNDLFNRDLSVNQNNNNVAQTGFGDALNSFTTTNNLGLNARQQNQSEFQQNVVAPTQTTFQNQYASYLNDNARTLNDYLTNYNINHTAQTDYWSRLKDVSGSGLNASTALPTG